MASMQAFLERDKERFLQNMASARSSAESVSAVKEELSRLLTSYNEEEESEKLKEQARMFIETLSASSSLLDCDGDSVIWSRSKYRAGISKPKRSVWFVIFLILGILCFGASCFILIYLTDAIPPSREMIIGLSVGLVSVICFLMAGIFSAKKKKENEEELYAETIPDPQKTYHVLLNSALTLDQMLEDLKNREILENRKAILEEKEELKKEDIDLLAGLLESAYSEKDNEYAAQVISDVSFYLHKKKIEVVDYDGTNKEYFERMPSQSPSTIRPALLIGGTILRKGLAAGE